MARIKRVDASGKKRSIRVPGVASLYDPPKTWFETWLTSIHDDYRENAIKVMVYEDKGGWTGYAYDKDGQIHKNMMLHIWPKWCWKTVLGPTSDIPSPPPITIEHAEKSQPTIVHDMVEFPLDPDRETTAQERRAIANFKEKERARRLKLQYDKF